MRHARSTWLSAGAGLAFLLAGGAEAHAHAADRGFVMLLPTGYYLFGGAAAVALSFLVLAVVPPEPVDRLARRRLHLGGIGTGGRLAVSGISFLFLAGLVLAGFFGSRDPLSNPLPLMVWTVWWVGLTLLHGVFGNLWAWLSPWYAPWRVVRCVFGNPDPPFRLPEALGHWPAVILFLCFAWFELVYPAPDDPERLAIVVAVYFGLTLLAMLAFGFEEWSARGECFSVFFAMIGRLGIVEARPGTGGGDRLRLRACLPGAKLADAPPLSASALLFLLLALSTVSFDGLMRTFFWLGLTGVNPLEFPGRSAVVAQSTLGLLAMFAALAGAFLAAIALGERLAGGRGPLLATAGRLVWSIIPISLAYHFSHYLTALVVDGQYALAALSDPLSNGADLLGTAGLHVQAGIVTGSGPTWVIWNLQAGAIILGHMLAVLVAHVVACRIHGAREGAVRSQIPLGLLMVGYTVFGLWLLSSPTAA